VPESLKDIFKISNKNRKRNKQKKKMRQDSVSDYSDDGAPFENIG
jgi:hypothetical protein